MSVPGRSVAGHPPVNVSSTSPKRPAPVVVGFFEHNHAAVEVPRAGHENIDRRNRIAAKS